MLIDRGARFSAPPTTCPLHDGSVFNPVQQIQVRMCEFDRFLVTCPEGTSVTIEAGYFGKWFNQGCGTVPQYTECKVVIKDNLQGLY